jgi:hypothetical protein
VETGIEPRPWSSVGRLADPAEASCGVSWRQAGRKLRLYGTVETTQGPERKRPKRDTEIVSRQKVASTASCERLPAYASNTDLSRATYRSLDHSRSASVAESSQPSLQQARLQTLPHKYCGK